MKVAVLIGIDIEAVREALRKIESPELQNEALKKALRATAEQARETLAKKAQESYTVKKVGFRKEMRIRTTSGKTKAATIHSEGAPLPLKDFKVINRQKTTKAKVIKSGSMKELKLSGIKAFVNNVARKGQERQKATKKGAAGSQVRHFAVAQRKGSERLEINKKFSNSIPVMLGSRKHVYGLVQPSIAGNLQDNLKRFVDQALGG